jgi:hypothetical protein
MSFTCGLVRYACGTVIVLDKKGCGAGGTKRRLHLKVCEICRTNSIAEYIIPINSRVANRKTNTFYREVLNEVSGIK